MEVAFGGFVEDLLGEGRGGSGCGGADCPEDDVEFRWSCRGEEVGRFAEKLVEFESGGVARLEAFREGATGSVREQLLGGP
jgi:hypothetical protein